MKSTQISGDRTMEKRSDSEEASIHATPAVTSSPAHIQP